MYRERESGFLNGLDGASPLLPRFRCSSLTYQQRLQALDDLANDLMQRREMASVPGLPFLAGFLQATNLTHLLAREVPAPGALERFVPVDERKSARLLPKGIVCHWMAGNVPLLGMFSWAVSVVAGNCNVIRVSSRHDDLVSPLLDRLAKVSEDGRELARETAVMRFDRDDLATQKAMSAMADVRIVWGGTEAVDAIRALPCDWECDTIVLGPRVSVAVLDPQVAHEAAISRLVTDIVYFDQLACSSPQWLFLKGRPGEPLFDAVIERMASEFDRQSRAFPRHELGFDETYSIQLNRARVVLDGGTLRRDDGTAWTMALVDVPQPRVACANRFLQVVPFDDIDSVTPQIPRNVQTAVTLLGDREMERFSEDAARRGVCRFPRPGEGNHFETPWDGIPLISRLTRWVLRTDGRGPMPNRGAGSGWSQPIHCSSN
jgi:acyl-CoA reductase-like NAD-dependent aldehyde dehydrogenase